MKEDGLPLSVMLLAGLATAAIIWGTHLLIERRRRAPSGSQLPEDPRPFPVAEMDNAQVRVHILAFTSSDCRQYQMFQAPVLRRLQEIFGEAICVTEIDIVTSPVFVAQYRVLTVPTTVLLDSSGQTHAVNYGFTNAQSLSRQVEEILALDPIHEALF